MGVGTGPLSVALVPHVKFLSGFDRLPHMLETARVNLEYLEQQHGFSRQVTFRNDADFSPHGKTPERLEMVFGEDMVRRLEGTDDWIMPECEGIRCRRK